MKNISVIDKNRCTGCMCCKNVCVNNAIDIYRDKEGFDYPYINYDKCLNCGKCIEYCPANSMCDDEFNYEYIYAVQADDDIRMNSSSGGMFTLLANEIINRGGAVCGAAFINGKVCHIVIDDIKDLSKLRKSKYVQSDISNVFEPILKLLKKGTKVLFSGTACQCEAIKNYCKNYDYGLYTVDVLCMGVPSPGMFEKYMKEEIGMNVAEVDFRDKSVSGWTPSFCLSYKKNNSKVIIKDEESSYYTAFLNGYALRSNCYQCKYSGKMRVSDISIGDFWGICNYDNSIDDGKGTSLVIISTEKGKDIFEWTEGKCKLIRKIQSEVATEYNPILKYPSADRGIRKESFKLYNSRSLKCAVEEISSNRADCGIINYWWSDDNGAILTAYALQQTLSKFGYTSKLIDLKKDAISGGISEKFARKYMSISCRMANDKDYYELNAAFDNFIVGSDQVFRAEWVSNHWFLDFVDDDKNKVAVSASYGKDALDVPKKRELEIKYLLSRFNSISVREEQGVELSKKLGAKAVNIIDPVFYLGKQEYIDKLNIRVNNEDKYIFVYIRDLTENKTAICEGFAAKFQYKLFFADDKTDVETFLEKILNSQMVITDSYHGLCFSLIFNKKYLCICNRMRGLERFNSLKKILQLDSRCFVDEEVDADNIEYKIFEEDWGKINSKIYTFSCEAQLWIYKALRKKRNTNKLNTFIKNAHLKMYIYYYKIIDNIKNKCAYAKLYLFFRKKDDNVVLFGAGVYGEKAVQIYGKRIIFFIDNSKNKKWLDGYPVLSLEKASRIIDNDMRIIITTSVPYQNEIMMQLKKHGYTNIEMFKDAIKY